MLDKIQDRAILIFLFLIFMFFVIMSGVTSIRDSKDLERNRNIEIYARHMAQNDADWWVIVDMIGDD